MPSQTNERRRGTIGSHHRSDRVRSWASATPRTGSSCTGWGGASTPTITPEADRVQRNDLFPAAFSLLAMALFAIGVVVPAEPLFIAAGIGTTCYGLAYLYVHELCIHERLPARRPAGRYVRWLRQMHRIHHLYNGEPYGMLLPVVPKELRWRARLDHRDPFARAASTRESRSRL